MPLDVTDLPRPFLDDLAGHSSAEIVRLPFYWTSQGQPLFGWWHANRMVDVSDHAVVIAGPLGYEQVHAHRSVRHLADALAQAGIPALRFDWQGTGDSAGNDEMPDRWPVWQTNLRDAVEFVKRQFGIRHVTVLGLRLGATLAATSFEADELENLILWAPVVSGRTYVREMTAIDRTSEIPPQNLPGEPLDLEPSGFVLTAETAQAVSQVKLLQPPRTNCPTLIVSRDDLPVDGKILECYRAAGIAAEQIAFAGYAEMMNSPHKGDVPWQAIRSMANWLTERVLQYSTTRPLIKTPLFPEMVFRYQPEGRYPAAANATLQERTIRISSAPDLFGILCEPTEPVDQDRPTIVLLNAGSAYRVGPGRLNVHLARRLSADGFRCLRLDASGLGDSPAQDQTNENQSYAATILRDVDLTLQFLRAHHLGERFMLIGLCSGAYFAFQSAVALPDPSLIESILINPLTYFWKDGMVITESSDRQVLVQQYYFESALNPRKWAKLLSGRTKIGVGGAAKLAAAKLQRSLGLRLLVTRSAGELVRPPHAHPLDDDLTADLDAAIAHGRRLTMFFAEGEPGHGILMAKAGKRARQLQRTGHLQIEFIPEADHNFSRRAARTKLIDAISTHFRGHAEVGA